MANNLVKINSERCKGCGLCVHACPKKILEIDQMANSRGYYTVAMLAEEKCIGCSFCALMCPDLALEIYRAEEGE